MDRYSKIAGELVRRLTPLVQLLRQFARKGASVAGVWGVAMVWFRSSFLPSQNYLIILAVVVGVLTGIGSVAFIYVLHVLTGFAQG